MDAVDETGNKNGFARDELSTVSGLALGNGILALATGRAIHVFSIRRPESALLFRRQSLRGAVGLNLVTSGRLLVWRAATAPARWA